MPTYVEFKILDKMEIVENRSVVQFVERENHENHILVILRLVLLSVGLLANFVVATVILAGKRTLHTAANCYVFSIVVSDVVVILQILLEVLRLWFRFHIHINGIYVSYVTLKASMLTIVIFALERYVVLCLPRSGASTAFGFSNGVKTVLVIWSLAVTSTAMELNLNLHFLTDTKALISLISTSMFLILPTIVVIALAVFVLVDTRKLNNNLDSDTSKVFLALAAVFYVSMVPYRIVSLVCLMAPTVCCSPTMLDGSYLIVELSAVVNPILYGLVSNNFRVAFKEILQSFCPSNRSTDNQVL